MFFILRHLLPKDYLRLWLIGDHVAEMSDAAGTSWLDTGARDWSDELLAATGLSRAQRPRRVEGSAVSGVLRDTLAERWGMGRVVVACVVAFVFAHIFENIGMCVLIMPITGIPLPLISYSGTFVVMCMFMLGLVQSVWIHRNTLEIVKVMTKEV